MENFIEFFCNKVIIYERGFIMKKNVQKRGLTLIEVMIAMGILMFAVIGAMGYRYYSALDTRKADEQITAGRIGQMLLEGWRGGGGRNMGDPYNSFNPVNLSVPDAQLLIANGSSGPPVPSGFTSFGSTYRVMSEGARYYATLSYKDEDLNGDGTLDMRILNAEVAWIEDYPTGNYQATDRTVRLTTKVDKPQ